MKCLTIMRNDRISKSKESNRNALPNILEMHTKVVSQQWQQNNKK